MQTITVMGGNLFQIAAQYLGDATQWNRLVQLNNLPPDFVITGSVTLKIPGVDDTQGGGILNYGTQYT